MVYLDYSATTPVNTEVLESFNKTSLEFIGNANSMHNLGRKAENLIEAASEQIADILNIKNTEIIYTSGATEANNLALKGIAFKYKNRGKHIITSHFEHSSVTETLKYLETLGYEISYIESNEFGIIDIDNLKSLIREDTILVTVNGVNSEIGIIEPVERIGLILKDYPKCFYHVDLTQWIGKLKINLENIDLASFSGHKIYGLKGIGALIKKENIELTPQINGGSSTTIYRSGTPVHPLIVSLSKALRLANENILEKYDYVAKLNKKVIENLKKYDKVHFNSNEYSIPHILNISIEGVKSETFMHSLEKYEIYVSTKTACSSHNEYSESVYNLTQNKDLASSSIRISLSHLTTNDEIDKFLECFSKCYQELVM